MQLTEGTLFHDRYTLVRLIGRGGFSEVWLATDKYTGLELALKVYAPNGGTDDTSIAIFSDEIRRVYNLSHPNLLKPQHFAVCEGMPYIVMPYCANGSVVKQIGKMSEAEIWTLLHDVATGLAYLHEQHIVHQDIKPDNILQAADGHYLITDFGISARTRTTLTKTQAISDTSAGTSAYMAPERFGSKPAPTFASDIWALGATLFELIEGYVPFGDGALPAGLLQKNGAEIPEIKAQISDTLKCTVRQMLALDARRRPTAKSLANGEEVFVTNKSTDSRKSRSFSFSDFLDILGGLFCFLIPFIGLILSILLAIIDIINSVRYRYIYDIYCIQYIIQFGGLLLFLGGKYLWAKESCLEGAKCWFNWCYKWADSRWGSIFIGGWSLILIALMITSLVFIIRISGY